jgi:hypothetical protein
MATRLPKKISPCDRCIAMNATVPLKSLASARSGDKGNHANIAVIANDAAAYRLLARQLTSERVGAYFSHLGVSSVERYELPLVGALNFVLRDALAGGASRSLRLDTQGKLLGTAILDMPVPLAEVDIADA